MNKMGLNETIRKKTEEMNKTEKIKALRNKQARAEKEINE
jgi:hypothetical protein